MAVMLPLIPPSPCSSSPWELGGRGHVLPCSVSCSLIPHTNHTAGTSPNSLWVLVKGLIICGLLLW